VTGMAPGAAHDPVRVLAVDDQCFFREVERDVVEATPGFRLVAEVSSGEAALAAVADVAPDLVLMDVRMPGIDGIEAARRIARDHPRIVVVLVSIDDMPSDAGRAGSAAQIHKKDLSPQMLRALWAVHGPGPAGDLIPTG
jgi:DNA-binding NarL/FixJ family response regulator